MSFISTKKPPELVYSRGIDDYCNKKFFCFKINIISLGGYGYKSSIMQPRNTLIIPNCSWFNKSETYYRPLVALGLRRVSKHL